MGGKNEEGRKERENMKECRMEEREGRIERRKDDDEEGK